MKWSQKCNKIITQFSKHMCRYRHIFSKNGQKRNWLMALCHKYKHSTIIINISNNVIRYPKMSLCTQQYVHIPNNATRYPRLSRYTQKRDNIRIWYQSARKVSLINNAQYIDMTEISCSCEILINVLRSVQSLSCLVV